MVVHTCDPSYSGGIGRRMVVQVVPGQKPQHPIQKQKQKHKGMEVWCGSS
jgi:hypothetical protein